MILKGKVLTPEGWADQIGVTGGVIGDSDGRVVDLPGCLILPGCVDLHGDGFERHLAPRRGAVGDMRAALHAVEVELAANGITTAMLAQFFSWEGGMRGPDFAERFAAALDAQSTMVDMRMQLRFETHLLDQVERAMALIARHDVGYVVWNDHVPHAALAKGKRPPRLTGQALKSGRSPEAHLALLQSLAERGADVPAVLAGMGRALRQRGTLIGSHDDDTAERRAQFRALGAGISEFPETRAAAEAAKSGGDAVILGAPNVVRGGSHKQNASAQDLIAEGLCDALASDYHYPSLIAAAFALADRGICDIAAAWRLISHSPAEVIGLSDRGALSPGRRADVIVLREETRQVEACFVAGKVAFLTGDVAARLTQ
ncbi:alpha-D-ribose 1-methylphosphonate 5-triphosphate diphosphatase [Rubricella aquisinus]|uniref:Alpha-D-ribose 1-methylphosphonate 5-triphosphate diphosphatase n=1 Tax=Rubricella aquisinus TaxID=2028108 RepID=A0A840WWK1_9RHOB|nr:alpha-D-ribose 1-methylphosphonate 5-triphosphate diphosphatase [Rubricella aquisinus]MBB5514086.1 alpha-D-ribose 1-methylphosphonate 5-triphosphate diphosphatase [Rubricella aquisinus]